METKVDTWDHDRLVAEECLFREAHAVLHDGLQRAKLTQREIARRLNVSEGRVSQIMSGSENLTLRSFASVAWAIGVSLSIRADRTRTAFALGREPLTPEQLLTHRKIEIPEPELPPVHRRLIQPNVPDGIAA